MKTYLQNFIFLRTELKYLLLISSVFILFIEFIGFSYDEIFSNANILANIILKICYSYISALIFYFLVVHYKRQDEKRKFYTILEIRVRPFFQEHNRIVTEICRANNNTEIDLRDIENIRSFLMNISCNEQYKERVFINQPNITWKNHLLYVAEYTKKDIEKIYLQSIFLDVELINLLEKLNEPNLFSFLRQIKDLKFDNQTLDVLINDFFDYTLAIHELNDYFLKEVNKYLNPAENYTYLPVNYVINQDFETVTLS